MAQATDKGLQLRCNVSRSGNTITWTIEVWSANYAWNDAQTLHWSGATSGSANYTASSAYGETRKMYSRTVSVTGTPGNTYTLWTSISGAFNGANPTPGGVSATIPVSAPSTPSAPTITRVSDNSHTVSWSRSASSAAPVTSQQVQRSEWNGSAWTAWTGVANVNTTYTNNGSHSWTDPGTKANRRYQYRIKASNSSGERYSSAYSDVYTTPGVPSSVTAVKTGADDIEITVAQTVTFSQHQTVLRYSTNGGTSWTALTTLNSGVNTYLWTSPPSVPSVLIDAAVRVNATGAVGNSLLSATRRSNSVGLTVPPNPPGGLTPNGVVVAAGEGSTTVSWTYNSADSSAQSAFEVQVNLDPATQPWTTVATGTTATSATLPAHLTASPLPDPLYWRVRTKGVHPDWSSYSASASFTVSARPVATVTSPSPVHESSRVAIGWSYSDGEGTAQSMWEAELHLGGQNIESKSGSGSATSILMDTTLVDATEYQALVRVRDGHGLWSPWDQATFTTNFPAPPKPAINLEWSRELGQMAISVLNPAGSPLVSYNVIQRSLDERDTWQDVVEVAYNGVGFDKTVPLGTRVWYRALAWTEVPSVSYSEEILYEDGYGEYGEPVINLFTNPELVGSGAYTTVAENLFTNPRLVGDGTWAVVVRNQFTNARLVPGTTQQETRRNYCANPKAESGTGYSSANNATRTLDPTGLLVECSPGVRDSGVGLPNGLVDVEAGPASISVEVTAVTACSLKLAVQGSGVIVKDTSYYTFTAGETKRIGMTYTRTGSGSIATYVLRSDSNGSEKFIVRNVLSEATAHIGEYFDYNTSPSPDLTPRALGTPGNSATVLEGTGVRAAGYNTRLVAIWSSKYPQQPMLTVPARTYGNQDTFVSPGGDTGALRLGFEPGKTYTAVVRARIEEPHVSVSSRSRSILFFSKIGSDPYSSIGSGSAPNEPGLHQLRLTFTVPVGATEAFIRLQNGSDDPRDQVWWGDFAVIEGEYPGDYDVNDPDMRIRWLGDENASESVMEIERVAGLSSNGCVAGVSTWEGKPAVRIIPLQPGVRDTFVQFVIPTNARAGGTVLGTLHLDEPLSTEYPEDTRPRSIGSYSPYSRTYAPNVAGSYPLRHQYDALTEHYYARWYNGEALGGGDVWWTDIGLFAGNYPYEAFNGESDPSETGIAQPEDFRIQWSGEVDNSTSVMEIERVAGLLSARCIAGVSVKNGKPAVRQIPTNTENGDSYIYFPIPTVAQGGGTLLASATLDAPLSAPLTRPGVLRTVLPDTYHSSIPNEAGTYPQRLSFVTTSIHHMRLMHGGLLGSGDIWWTDIGLFAGEYDGHAFSGDTTGSDLDTYGWNGEPNNSTSFRLTRDTVPAEHTLGYWSAGTDLNQLVKMEVNLSNPPFIDLSSGLASKTLHYFSGRKSPVETTGEATARTGAVSFMVMTEEELHVARAMALLPAPHLFRLPDKTHVWASIGAVTDKRIDNGAYQITFQITEVDYNG